MKLQKFFRKYQKPMMGILGAVLIVGWLVGDAIRNLFSARQELTLATSLRYGKVTSLDSAQAEHTQRLIGMMNPNYDWRSPVDNGRLPQPPMDMADWIILGRELHSHGLGMGADAVSSQFADPAEQDGLTRMAVSNRTRKEDLLGAYAQFVSYQLSADFTASSATPSLAEVRQLAHRTLEKAKINAVLLPASAFEDESATFTDEQLAAQYASAKENESGAGLDFGYVLEDAVKVEYIEIDRKAIEQSLKVDEAKIEREAKKYWEENRTAPIFRRPKEEPKPEPEVKPEAPAAAPTAEPAASEESKPGATTEQPSTKPTETKDDGDTSAGHRQGGPWAPASTLQPGPVEPTGSTILAPQDKEKPSDPPAGTAPAQPAGADPTQAQQPAATQSPPSPAAQTPPAPGVQTPPAPPAIAYFETWEEAREGAVKQIRQQYTGAAAQELATALQARLNEPWIGILAAKGGYKPAPESVKAEGYYTRVIEQTTKSLGYAEALKCGTTGLFTRSEAAALPGLGAAMYFEAGRSRAMGLSSLAFNVEGLATIVEGADRFLFLSKMETSRYALTSVAEGKTYLFRVIETRASRAPQSLDEVRDRVVKDLRLKAGWEEARKRGEALLAAAGSASLKEAFDADASLVSLKEKNVSFLDPIPFGRMSNALTGDLANRPNVGIMGLGSVKPEVADRIFALADSPAHRELIPLEDRAAVLVVEWKETLPARSDEYDRFRAQQAARLASIRASAAKREFLRPSNIRARAGVEAPK